MSKNLSLIQKTTVLFNYSALSTCLDAIRSLIKGIEDRDFEECKDLRDFSSSNFEIVGLNPIFFFTLRIP